MGACCSAEDAEMRRVRAVTSRVEYSDAAPFLPRIRYGRVVKVYDGDTITIATVLPRDATVYRFSVRLARIDAPELRTSDATEKKCAERVRDIVHRMVYQQIVRVDVISYDKYGRILAEIYHNNINLSDYLLAQRLAVRYDGKTKQEWNNASLSAIMNH